MFSDKICVVSIVSESFKSNKKVYFTSRILFFATIKLCLEVFFKKRPFSPGVIFPITRGPPPSSDDISSTLSFANNKYYINASWVLNRSIIISFIIITVRVYVV